MKREVSLLIAVLMLISNFNYVNANNINQLQQQQQQYQQELQRTQSQLNQAKQERATVANKVAELDNAVSAVEQSLNEVEKRLSEINSQIESTEIELADNIKEFDENKELLKKRVRAMYIYCSDYSYLDVILQSKCLDDFQYRSKLMNNVLSHDKELIKFMDNKIKNIKQKKHELENQKVIRENEKVQREQRTRELNASRAAKNEYLRQINANIKELEQMEDYLLEQSERIAAQIKAATDKNLEYSDGQMTWPLPGISKSSITSHFGNRFHPILKVDKMHTGVDIGAGSGTDIVAANKGKVIFAGFDAGYGNYVIIDHGVKDGNSISTLYAHASKLLVKTGDEVEAGQVIAKVGSTGYSTGPHLHFEVRKNGTPVSPKDYLNY